MNELRKIKPKLISLVNKAANKTSIIYKSADQPADSKSLRSFEIIRKDDEKKLIYGIVYSPNKEDTQGDFATAEEIEKAAHTFMKSLDSTAKVDTGHNLKVVDGVNIVQSYIINKGDELYPDDPGAWAIVVKVDNDELWSQVKDGTFTGFSMYGTAERITNEDEVTKEDISTIKKFVNVFKSFLNTNQTDPTKMDNNKVQIVKDFNTLIGVRDIQDFTWALQDSIREVMNDENITDKKAAINTNIEQFQAKVNSIVLGKAIAAEVMTGEEIDVAKADKVLTEDKLTKLTDATTALNYIIQKSKTKPETTMDPIIQKQIDDAVKTAVEAKQVELKKESDAKITELTDKVTELTKENDELKKASKGSGQEIDDKGNTIEKSAGTFGFLGLKSTE